MLESRSLHERQSLSIEKSDRLSTDWWTTETAAAYIGISTKTLRRMIASGQVPATRVGPRRRHIRTKREWIDQALGRSA